MHATQDNSPADRALYSQISCDSSLKDVILHHFKAKLYSYPITSWINPFRYKTSYAKSQKTRFAFACANIKNIKTSKTLISLWIITILFKMCKYKIVISPCMYKIIVSLCTNLVAISKWPYTCEKTKLQSVRVSKKLKPACAPTQLQLASNLTQL